MSSKELWDLLENSNTREIQSMLTMCVVYLIKSRNIRLKEIIKDIKDLVKGMEV